MVGFHRDSGQKSLELNGLNCGQDTLIEGNLDQTAPRRDGDNATVAKGIKPDKRRTRQAMGPGCVPPDRCLEYFTIPRTESFGGLTRELQHRITEPGTRFGWIPLATGHH